MLQSIRDRTQGWIAGIIISLLILTFALWGIHSWIGGGSVTTTVAKVNGVEISKAQLNLTYERMRHELQAQHMNNALSSSAEAGLKDRALKTLILTQVLKQASFKQGYRISEPQVESFLQSMPEFQQDGQFSVTRFQQLLSAALLSPTDFLELIQTTLMIDQPRMGMIFTSFASPKEVQNAIGLIYQKRNIQYALLPYSLVPEPNISDAQTEAYYKQHANEFKTKEQVSLNYLVLSIKDIMNKIPVNENDLKNFYEDNSSSFTAPAEWKLQTILVPIKKPAEEQQASDQIKQIEQQAKQGKTFSDLVQQNKFATMAPTLQNWVTLNQLPIELQQALLKVSTKLILDPIKTKQGFVLLKIEDVKPSQILSFDQAKQKVKEYYLHQKAEEQFADAREKFANLTYEHPDTLEPAAKELNLTIQSSELFSKDKGNTGVSANKQVREAAFSNDVLFSQNNSDVIQYNGDSAIVIRIKSHVPAALMPLSVVKPEIIQKLTAAEKEAKTFELAQTIQKQLQLGQAPQLIAAQYHFNWITVGLIGRYSNKLDTAILNTAFTMPILKNSNKMTYAINKMPNGYVIIELKEVQPGVMHETDQYRIFSDQIQNTEGLVEYELYKKSCMNKAKILIL